MNQSHPSCVIELRHVSFTVADKPILSDVSVKVPPDGVTGLIGPSGSGKSTFLRLLNRLITPTAGEMLFRGHSYDELSPRELRKEVGLVQQRPYLFEGTVRDNLNYGPQIWGIDYNEEKLQQLLERVALPTEFLNRDVRNLSGGEQQRVSLARSLANQPKVILMDEPTSSLDINSEEIVEETIERLVKDGIKIIIVSHDLGQTQRLTDQLLFLRGGELVEQSTTKEFFSNHSEREIRGFFRKEVK